MSGPPMEQIALAEPAALPGEATFIATLGRSNVTLLGEIVLSAQAWDTVEDVAQGSSVVSLIEEAEATSMPRKQTVDRNDLLGYIRLEGLSEVGEVLPQIAPHVSKLTAKHMPVLKRYIPRAIFSQLAAQHDKHLGEMRPVSPYSRFTASETKHEA